MSKKKWAVIGSSAGVLLLAGVTVLVVLLNRVKTIPYVEDEKFISKYTYKNQPTMGVGDPYLFTDNGKYYFTGTNDGVSYNLRVSEDLKTWKPAGKIFSKESEGAWGTKEYWQPQVIKGPDGKYYLYYCAHYPPSGFSRIGVAVCDTVDGDYREVHGKPLFDPGYSVIDPHVFIDDDGQIYLYYSRGVSQNVVGGIKTSQIYVVKMKSMTELADGAEYVQLTTPTQGWETQSTGTRWNEGPDILKHDGKYYLFLSANNFATRNYSIGYATADSPMRRTIRSWRHRRSSFPGRETTAFSIRWTARSCLPPTTPTVFPTSPAATGCSISTVAAGGRTARSTSTGRPSPHSPRFRGCRPSSR